MVCKIKESMLNTYYQESTIDGHPCNGLELPVEWISSSHLNRKWKMYLEMTKRSSWAWLSTLQARVQSRPKDSWRGRNEAQGTGWTNTSAVLGDLGRQGQSTTRLGNYNLVDSQRGCTIGGWIRAGNRGRRKRDRWTVEASPPGTVPATQAWWPVPIEKPR